MGVEAANELGNCNVVSMPCWELFEEQNEEYRKSVFIPGVPVVSVEAGVTMGWGQYAHASVGINQFGASGPGKQVFAHFGLTKENVVAKANKLITHFQGKSVP